MFSFFLTRDQTLDQTLDGRDGPSSDFWDTSTVNNPDADVTYRSSNGVLFKLFRKHVEVNAPGLPLPDNDNDAVVEEPSTNRAISLAESSITLNLLFGFVRAPSKNEKNVLPSLSEIAPNVLFAVAEAAEKYGVFNAVNVSLIRMERMVQEKLCPLEIVNFADRHGYNSMGDEAAILSLCYRDTDLVKELTNTGLLSRFLIFRDQYTTIKNAVLEAFEANPCKGLYGAQICSMHTAMKAKYFEQVNEDLAKALKVPSTAPTMPQCSSCTRNGYGTWYRLAGVIATRKRSLEGLSKITL